MSNMEGCGPRERNYTGMEKRKRITSQQLVMKNVIIDVKQNGKSAKTLRMGGTDSEIDHS